MVKAAMAVVQFRSIPGKVAANTIAVVNMMARIRQDHPKTQLIIFPEMCLYGYAEFEKIKKADYETALTQALITVAAAARKHQVAVVIGFGRKDADSGRFYNSLAYLDQAGRLCCHYDKMHLVGPERDLFEAGREYVLIDTPVGRAGLLICWDCSFPEPARLYAQQGADFLIVSAAWEAPYVEQWEVALRARAMDNGLFVAGANRSGQDLDTTFGGRSMIIDRMGRIAARTTGSADSYVCHAMDFAATQPERDDLGNPLLELRPETYQADHVKTCRG